MKLLSKPRYWSNQKVRGLWGTFGSSFFRRANASYLSRLTWRHLIEMGQAGPESSVLDVGCGWGRIASHALEDGVGDVYGAEITDELIRQARSSLPDWKRIAQADARSLPYGAGVMDLTFAVRVLQYFEDPTEPLREMRRVTRSGGTVAVVQPNARSPYRWIGYHTVLLKPDATRRWMEEAGLVDLELRYFGYLPRRLGSRRLDGLLGRVPGLASRGAYFVISGRVP